MTDPAQFGTNKPSEKATSGPFDCAVVELWMAESAEKTLSPKIEEQIHAHAGDCPACQEKLAQAQGGREWLLLLKQEALEPPADLVSKILARTSLAKASADENIISTESRQPSKSAGQDSDTAAAHTGLLRNPIGHQHLQSAKGGPIAEDIQSRPASVPMRQRNPVVVLRRTVLEPRLALVAAMAFFSISLTLNLMGIRLGNLHAADLAPNNMRHAITRQYADANARVVRYYENSRVVYEVEARVQQIRRASETIPPPEPEKKPRKRSFNFSPGSHDAVKRQFFQQERQLA